MCQLQGFCEFMLGWQPHSKIVSTVCFFYFLSWLSLRFQRDIHCGLQHITQQTWKPKNPHSKNSCQSFSSQLFIFKTSSKGLRRWLGANVGRWVNIAYFERSLIKLMHCASVEAAAAGMWMFSRCERTSLVELTAQALLVLPCFVRWSPLSQVNMSINGQAPLFTGAYSPISPPSTAKHTLTLHTHSEQRLLFLLEWTSNF